MKFTKTYSSALLLALLILLMGSCRKNQSSGWNTQLLVPIVTTSLSLQNLVTDSTLKMNRDSSLTLSYSSTLYQFNLADQIVQIPDTAIGQKFNVDSLSLPNLHLDFTESLGQIAGQLGSFGQLILTQQGQPSQTPTIALPNVFSYGFDASILFDSAQLVGGEAQVTAVNGLPVAIAAGTSCIVRDSITGNILQDTTFPAIPAHDSIYIVVPLRPNRISSHLLFTVGHLVIDSSGNNTVIIDTNNAITLHVFVDKLHVSEAWAKVPAQNVIDQTGDVTFDMGARKFSYIDARSGFLHIKISNSVPQPLYLQYTLIGAYNKLGQPLNEFTNVGAADSLGHPATIDTMLDITGYSINLTGQHGSNFNTYTQRVVCRLNYTGETQHITVQDSLNVKYELINIKPNYVKGYMGKDTVTNVDSAAFNFLNVFKSGSIDLASVNMNFSVVNAIGVDGQIKINNLVARSSNNGSKTLTSSLLGQPLYVRRATDFPLTPAVSNFSLNNSNSNIKDLLGILPNQLQYNISVQTNVHGNTNQYRDFAYLQSGLSVNLNAEIPLSLIANGLVLKDTIGFNLANTQTNVNGISDGILNIIAENKYPIQGVLTMIIYDANWNALDTLALNKVVAAGNLDANCRVDQPTQSVLQEYVDNNRVNKLKQGAWAVVTSDFSTVNNTPGCNGQHLKIYSNYSIGITLSAKFNYKVSTKL